MIKNKNCKKVCFVAATCFAVGNMVAQDSKLFENDNLKNKNGGFNAKLTQTKEQLLNLEHDVNVLIADNIVFDGKVYSKTVNFNGETIVIVFDKNQSSDEQLSKIVSDYDDVAKKEFITKEFLKLVEYVGFEQNNNQLVSAANEVNNEEQPNNQVISVENNTPSEVKDNDQNISTEQEVKESGAEEKTSGKQEAKRDDVEEAKPSTQE